MGLATTPASSLDYSRITIVRLAWPLLVENILRISLSSVDTLMLSHYSPETVAAMSVAAQLGFFVQLIYSMVSSARAC